MHTLLMCQQPSQRFHRRQHGVVGYHVPFTSSEDGQGLGFEPQCSQFSFAAVDERQRLFSSLQGRSSHYRMQSETAELPAAPLIPPSALCRRPRHPLRPRRAPFSLVRHTLLSLGRAPSLLSSSSTGSMPRRPRSRTSTGPKAASSSTCGRTAPARGATSALAQIARGSTLCASRFLLLEPALARSTNWRTRRSTAAFLSQVAGREARPHQAPRLPRPAGHRAARAQAVSFDPPLGRRAPERRRFGLRWRDEERGLAGTG
ncbi:hypothetical protein DMC30DRAFT_239228 [Rhodotorula diobovata]|uniref:Uncharacterized protein n=1 Tax=Rhodotorula diobovata TaxID=5288 RepID=A0A5C5G4G4_9BASI|nr:hypothetical protein DMC30DRAFT_239228 [Rhodotorula diobovata]